MRALWMDWRAWGETSLPRHLAELFFLAWACWLLQQLALDLAQALPAWQSHLHKLLEGVTASPRKAARVMALHANAGVVLTQIALGGWFALVAGRLHVLHAGLRVVLIAALWYATALWVRPYDWPGEIGKTGFVALVAPDLVSPTVVTGGGLFLLLAALALALQFAASSTTTAVRPPAAVLRYPLFVLLTGVGALWLLDFSARGYAKLRWLGVDMVDAIFVASVVLTVVATLGDALLAALSRLLSRKGVARAAAVLVVIWCVALVALGEHSALHAFGLPTWLKLRPAVTSELLRIPFVFATAWLFDC